MKIKNLNLLMRLFVFLLTDLYYSKKNYFDFLRNNKILFQIIDIIKQVIV